jgi:hypothetical protein
MSIYNMIFGKNPASAALLALLGLKESDVGRFRDVYFTDAGEIAVYTRNGGGNRDCWGSAVDGAVCRCPGCIIEHHLPKHPQYLRDEDDDFDHTYATIYFSIPDEYRDEIATMGAVDWKPSQRWIDAIEQLNKAVTP